MSAYSADKKLPKLVCRAKRRNSTTKPTYFSDGFRLLHFSDLNQATPIKAIFQVYLASLDVYIEIDS